MPSDVCFPALNTLANTFTCKNIDCKHNLQAHIADCLQNVNYEYALQAALLNRV